MENEVMEYEEVLEPEVDVVETDSEDSGIGTGMAIAIGAGLTLAATAAVKFGKKAYAKFKAKKGAEEDACDHDFVIPNEDELNGVAK